METRLKAILKEKGLKQKDLAKQIGVSEMTITRFQRGVFSPSLLETIANALGVSVGALFLSPTDLNTFGTSDDDTTCNDLCIKQICHQRGLTQKELAKLVGMSSLGLSKAMNGNTTIATLRKIASALNVPISALFVTTEQPNKGFVCPKCGTPLAITIEEKQ